MKSFVDRHQLGVYVALTFTVSWSAILAAAGPDGLPLAEPRIAAAGVGAMLGPSLGCLAVLVLSSGSRGLRDLRTRLMHWRAPVSAYAAAVLVAPVTTILALLLLRPTSDVFVPAVGTTDQAATLVAQGLVAGLLVAVFEEVGWTGLAVPRVRQRFGVLTTGLVVGVVWGFWHLPLFLRPGSLTPGLALALLLAQLFSWLPAYRVLMAWVYDRSDSLPAVIVMHTSLVASTVVIEPSLTGSELLRFILARAAVLWLAVALLALAGRHDRATA